MPLFAIRPMASAVSSMLNPRAPAMGAAYLNVSPIMATFVFALEEAAARTSAKCPESSADSPNAVSASVTMSDVVARLSPDAAARFMIPSMPPTMSAAFQPAMAMYSMASPASDAENFVSAPISRALSRRVSISAAVAPDIAPTLLICWSKSAVSFTAAPRPAAAAADIGMMASPMPFRRSPVSCRPLPISWRPFGMFLSSCSSLLSSAVASLTACFHFSVC